MAPMTRRRLKTLNSLQISSAATVASIEDLLIEIFMHLAVKPLVKFKSISKQWYSIISQPQFIINHARKNPRLNGLLLKSLTQEGYPPLSLIHLENFQPPTVLPIQFLNNPGANILHSCKGLLCYSVSQNYMDVAHDPNASVLISYHVCNPTSGHSTRIRVFNAASAADLRSVNIAFDPSKSIHYKVIFVRRRMSLLESNRLIKFDIYSSETRSWKFVKEVVYDVGFNNRGVYWNGAIYWYDTTRRAIFYFDLEAECLKSMPTPTSTPGSPKMHLEYFGESSGCLHLITTRRPLGMQFTIYEMQRDKSDWIVKYNGDLSFMTIKYPKMVCGRKYRYYVYRPLCLVEEEKKEESNLVLAIPGKVISFNLKDKALKVLCDLKPAISFGALAITANKFKTYQYMETLACI